MPRTRAPRSFEVLSVRRRGFETTRSPAQATMGVDGRIGTIVGTSSASPSYVPVYAESWDAGTVGATPPGWSPAGVPTVSTDIIGPFGESRIVKVTTGVQLFGAEALSGSAFSMNNGDSLWVAVWYYFPTAFCAGYGSSSGDGWGVTKWLRLQQTTTLNGGDASRRLTLQVNNFSSQSCSTTGPALWGMSAEGAFNTSPDPQFGLSGWSAYTGAYGSQAPVERRFPRNQWFQLQYKIVAHDTVAGSSLEMWNNGNYLGVTGHHFTAFHSGTGALFWRMVIGDYWNGGPPDASRPQSFYMSNMIITKEQPNTRDSGGRPYIDPSTRAQDFA